MSAPLAVTAGQGGRRAGPSGPARIAAARWGLPFLEREHKVALTPHLGVYADAFLVLGGDGWSLRDAQGVLRYSPGMAMLRIKRLEAGHPLDDQLLRQGEVRPGDVVFDGSLGLGADALVCAKAVGPSGRVIAVERSLALCALVAEGLRLPSPFRDLAPIDCLHGDSGTVLQGMADASVDVVLFDPMFEVPLKASPAFEVLRRYASFAPLTAEMLQSAKRVARRCVLVKRGRASSAPAGLSLVPDDRRRFGRASWLKLGGAPQ
jgi:16S rRNA (guanine1516-N2)-methyltransferase